jgi:hypothetical protein
MFLNFRDHHTASDLFPVLETIRLLANVPKL